MKLSEKLKAIRDLIDVNTADVDLDSLINHAQELASMIGLSSECKAEARKKMEESRLVALHALIDKKMATTVLLKMADGAIAHEIESFEYSDRLNAGISHKLDLIRTIVSLRKVELENSMKQ